MPRRYRFLIPSLIAALLVSGSVAIFARDASDVARAAAAIVAILFGYRLTWWTPLADERSRRKWRGIFEGALDAVVVVDADGIVTDWNGNAERIFGWRRTDTLGRMLNELIVPARYRGEYAEVMRSFRAGGGMSRMERRIEIPAHHRDGHELQIELAISPVKIGRRYEFSAFIRDITKRKLAQMHEQHHNKVLGLLTAKAPLAAVLDAIARDAEALHPAVLCSILLLDEEGRYLRLGAAPSLPDFYGDAVDGMPIGPDVSACGVAAFTAQPAIVEDVEGGAVPAPYLDLARRAGLRACWSHPITSAQGKVLGTFAFYHRRICRPSAADLEFIEQEARLAALAIENTAADARLQLAASVFTHAREGITITDTQGVIVEVNSAFTRITGYSREEAIGQNPRILKSGRQPAEYYGAMWQALTERGYWYGEIWNRRKDGTVYAEMLTISAVRDADGRTQSYVALFTDITPMKEHQKQLERIAHYDALTGLPNRVLLADRLQQAMAQSQRRDQSLAVVYLDLDGFKAVNDKHGHDVGDELLIAIAERMRTAMREGDTLARIGGDEFVAVLVDLAGVQDCELVLDRLLQAAADPVKVDSLSLHVSASIGVTLYPQDGTDADLLLRHADQAMYSAKQAGKNRYHLFDVVQDAAVKTQHESIEHIRRGLDGREFVLHYQPKVNMKTGVVVGVEALIRWQHPELGLLQPAEFLPVVENHPLSIELGEWVIDTALAQMAEWYAAGLAIPVSVNVGARQVQHEDFVARLTAMLAAHPDVPPCGLELELLETSALEDMLSVTAVMHDCRAAGVHFALDDFGTGYSSLTYLKRLPAELLKIDQTFVRDMLEDPEDLAIVEGVVGLAAAFRRRVMAEGVETVAHGELLLSLGCELAQGFGIARPMPAAELPDWIAGWRPDPAWTAWSGHSPNNDDRVIVFAEVKHRHWLKAVETYLAGERDEPPPMDAGKCDFGIWQETEARSRYGNYPEFPAVVELHHRVHALGRELIELHVHGRGIDGRLGELHVLRDELIERLRVLARGVKGRQPAGARHQLLLL